MIVNNVGYNHCHDSDFFINRPNGSGDNLLLLLKTDTIFNIDGEDVLVMKDSFFIYRKGRPQYYRCLPQSSFSNDWIHFEFEPGEEEVFLSLGLEYERPVKLSNLYFLSFCIKMTANEFYSQNVYKHSNISHYISLIFNNVAEQLVHHKYQQSDNYYEMLSTIRNKIYVEPYINRNIDYAAHEVRMSRSNFQHLYKKYFNVSFIQDLINSRMEHAKMLLLNTGLNSTDIAVQCGYRSYAHFERQFRKNNGMSPIEYRKKFQKTIDR